MPEPGGLQQFHAEGQVLIYRGPHVFAAYDEDDLGMRNLAIVGLTNARFSCKDVARCFGLTPQYVSMLRGRARDRGSAGLVRPRGRRRSLSDAQLARAAEWSRHGMSDVAIGKRLGVHSGTVGRRLAAMRRDLPSGEPLVFDVACTDEEGSFDPVTEEASEPEATRDEQSASDQAPAPIAGLRDTEVTSRYAGAMLLHPFLTRLGVDQILSALPTGAARRYDAASLVLASTFSFALGTSSKGPSIWWGKTPAP